MRKAVLVLAFLLAVPIALAAQSAPPSPWHATVDQALPLLGHRNWILIVDSAYPLQTSPGVETVETNADQLDVVRYVLGAINKSIHVRPDIFMDAELPYVQEEDAPGTSAYRDAIAKLLDGQTIQSELHEKLIDDVDRAGKLVHVLVLKTRLAVPYSSVFIRLNGRTTRKSGCGRRWVLRRRRRRLRRCRRPSPRSRLRRPRNPSSRRPRRAPSRPGSLSDSPPRTQKQSMRWEEEARG
jgi:hypothetical protein